jgi:hypothetical protein
VQRPPRVIQFIFEVANLFPQPVAFTAIAVPLAFDFLALTAQAFVLALSPFQFGDQFFARGRAPARLHALVMPRLDWKYKIEQRRSRRSDEQIRVTTR